MKQKSSHPRKEFAIFILSAGIIFAFAGHLQGEEITKLLGDFAIPLQTQVIAGPEDECFWIGYSPVNDQAAFVAGLSDRRNLYVSQAGEPNKYELLWEPAKDYSIIRSAAWSPNGKEIAFIVQDSNESMSPKFSSFLLYTAEVGSRLIREPIIISESIGKTVGDEQKAISRNVLSWYGDTCVCIPANNGGLLKFDTHTGQSETLIAPQEGFFISSIALTRTGELRFIKYRKLEPGKGVEYFIGGLGQDGAIHDYGNLTRQLGRISAYLSKDGEFVFATKKGEELKSRPAMTPILNIIYKIESRSVIGQIPAVIDAQKDMYYYTPLDVQNDNELILLEGRSPEVDGGNSMRSPIMRIAKMTILPDKQYKTAED